MLEKMTKGRTEQPLRIVVGGGPGVGKTTFASQAPGALICDFERGSGQIECDRVDINSVAELNELMAELEKQKGETYQTLVIDSIDWMQTRVFQEVVSNQHDSRIKDVAQIPYGQGYGAGAAQMVTFLTTGCERLRTVGMHIILIAHMIPRALNDNPELLTQNRHSLKLYEGKNTSIAGPVREWADYVLYAAEARKSTVIGEGRDKRLVPKMTGHRVLLTHASDTWEAKSRRPIPHEIPLEWDAFWNAHTEA